MNESCKISVIISTYNRCGLWVSGGLWKSLLDQTNKDFELVIADDGSTDATLLTLQRLRSAQPPCASVRILALKRDFDRRDSAVADNALFRAAKGNWFLHLDDDGWVHPGAVQFARRLADTEGAYYGRIISMLNGKQVGDDVRVRWFGGNAPVCRIPKRTKAEWGALWFAPAWAIYRIGGHDVSHLDKRGCDNRLGWSLRAALTTWFVNTPEFTFHHHGLSHYNQTPIADYIKESSQPSLHGDEDYKPVVNGGGAFWFSDWFTNRYFEI